MAEKKDIEGTALYDFVEELKAARAKAGLTREELGAKIGYSGSQIGMIESYNRFPTLKFAQLCDKVFDAPGTFVRLHKRVRDEPLPAYYRPFVIHEAEASALYTFQLTLVPGLLQTEDYARALFKIRMMRTEEEIETSVMRRMERQTIWNRPKPPPYWVVLDESVLHRSIGGRETMHRQCEHLIEMTQRPNIMLQVVPSSVGEYVGVDGSLVIADFADRPSMVYVETMLTGFTIEKPEHVTEVRLSYEALRAEAISPSASLALLKEITQTWT